MVTAASSLTEVKLASTGSGLRHWQELRGERPREHGYQEEEALEKDGWIEKQRRRNKKKKGQFISRNVGSPKVDIRSTSRSQVNEQKRIPALPRGMTVTSSDGEEELVP